MELKAGNCYVTRDGDPTTPLQIIPKRERIAGLTWTAEVRGFPREWSPDGSWAPGYVHGLDLVKPLAKR